MTLPAILSKNLRIPVVAAPLFIISNPKLVIAQCKAGVVGSFPALNARPASQLAEWLDEITSSLESWNRANPDRPAAPFAVNQIVHKSNQRLQEDMAVCVKYKVPIVITSLGAVPEVNQAVHGYGGIVLHDIIHNTHAKKAVERGADGLIAVATGAGGHAGRLNPIALLQDIRDWYQGTLLLSGSIATGQAVLAAQILGADLAYIGTPFISTHESQAPDAYKQMIVDSTADDILYSSYFTGVHGNYLRNSVVNAGLDPDNLPEGTPQALNLEISSTSSGPKFKAWKDIWGAGQGVGAIKSIQSTQELVTRLETEYQAAKRKFL